MVGQPHKFAEFKDVVEGEVVVEGGERWRPRGAAIITIVRQTTYSAIEMHEPLQLQGGGGNMMPNHNSTIELQFGGVGGTAPNVIKATVCPKNRPQIWPRTFRREIWPGNSAGKLGRFVEPSLVS